MSKKLIGAIKDRLSKMIVQQEDVVGVDIMPGYIRIAQLEQIVLAGFARAQPVVAEEPAKKVKKAFEYADRVRGNRVFFVAPDEWAQKKVRVKDLRAPEDDQNDGRAEERERPALMHARALRVALLAHGRQHLARAAAAPWAACTPSPPPPRRCTRSRTKR